MPVAARDATTDVRRFLAEFVRFEAELGVFSLRLRGRLFWDYVRYAIAHDCLEQLHAFEFVAPGVSRGALPGDFWTSLAHLALTPFRRPAECDWLVINYSRTSQLDGREVNMHTYPLMKHFAVGRRVLLVDAQPLSVPVEDLYPGPVLRSRPGHLLDRVRTKAEPITARERVVLAGLAAALQQRFGVSVDLAGLVRTHFLFQLHRLSWYRRLLATVRPRIVLYCDDANQKGLIEAATEAGIPTVDMQHSLISDLNLLYLYPEQLREPLPTMSDYIFTFGEFWNPHYRLPVPRRAVGFPYFEQQRHDALARATTARDKGIIVVSMTYPRECTARVAMALATELPDFTIYYKLRQEEFSTWRERYPAGFAAQPNLVVIDSNETPLYDWFARCSYQVGINSTAICEGIGFGLTTFILEAGWYKEMAAFYEAGHMFLVERADQIAAIIRSGTPVPSPLHADALFKPGALANLALAVDDVIAAAPAAAMSQARR